jgi:hypothetical protein
LSRLDRKFTAADEAPLDAAEILAALEAQAADSTRDRHDAIACYLSGEDGWRDASAVLGGTFAEPQREGGGGAGKEREDDINQRVSEYLQRPPLKAERIDDD